MKIWDNAERNEQSKNTMVKRRKKVKSHQYLMMSNLAEELEHIRSVETGPIKAADEEYKGRKPLI